MNPRLIALVPLLLILLLSSCQEKSNFTPNGEVIIAGKILNFEKHKNVENFQLLHHNLLEIQKIETVEIKNDGSFQVTIPCHYKMDFFIGFGRIPAYLVCAPNDSIFLTIDADILNDPKNHYPNDSYFVKMIGGNRVNDNQFVNEFLRRTKNSISRTEYLKIIKTYTPIEYLEYLNKLEEFEMTVLDSLLQLTDSDLFKAWAIDFSKYKKLDKLLKYPALHAKLNKLEDSPDIPLEYFNKVFSEGINDTIVFSFFHSAFFYSYNSHLYTQAKKEGLDLVKYINRNATGFSRDIVLAKHYYSSNKKSETPININLDLISNEYIKDLLTQETIKQETRKAELLKIKTHSTFSDSLFSPYKGKVVYVDFWAPWCAPCLKEMKHTKVLQEKYKDKSIEFLFLGNQCKSADWEKTIKEKELKGTHILLTDEQFSELEELFGISGIPHYVIVNKQGGFINNAKRPSNKEIGKELNRLINE